MKSDRTGIEFRAVFRLTSPENGVLFDIDGDETPEQVAWTEADGDVALLAIDRNGNGVIDNATELFGNHTVNGVLNGIEALDKIMPLDMSEGGAGEVNHADPVYSKLLLWTDRNHNGVSEASELRPASDVLTALGLAYVAFNRTDQYGNQFWYQGWLEIRTAPGLNRAATSREHQERLRWLYEVALRRK